MAEIYRLCAPCLFGLEGIAANELRRMGMKNVTAEDGRVLFDGDLNAAATACVELRTAERVTLVAAEFEATTFDQLFEKTKATEWERFIPQDGAFPLRGHCLSSELMSVPDCRSIIKKAVATRLGEVYGVERLPQTGSMFLIRFTVLKNRVTLQIDLTGDALHKRGYRALSGGAPIRETLAAGMVILSGYRGKGAFRDPFCGSGTIAIEAALIAKNRAPGLNRAFELSSWKGGDEALELARQTARAKEFDGDYDILGGDTDKEMVELARQNAFQAGVGDIVRFERGDALEFSETVRRGVVVTNPPYGERMGDGTSAAELMRGFGSRVVNMGEKWQAYIISSDGELEKHIGMRAVKRRKLYNGMMRCDLYTFEGKGLSE